MATRNRSYKEPAKRSHGRGKKPPAKTATETVDRVEAKRPTPHTFPAIPLARAPIPTQASHASLGAYRDPRPAKADEFVPLALPPADDGVPRVWTWISVGAVLAIFGFVLAFCRNRGWL